MSSPQQAVSVEASEIYNYYYIAESMAIDA
jgi:hypothetical protein